MTKLFGPLLSSHCGVRHRAVPSKLLWVLAIMTALMSIVFYYPLTAAAQPTFVSASYTDFSYRGAKLSSYGATMYPYFTVNGTTLRGSAWGHSAFPQYIDSILNMAAQDGMNTIRAVDFLQGTADPYHATVWANMDYLLSQAAARKMFVILDLSSYRNMLHSRGMFPYDPAQWTTFLKFVGVRYADSPALLYYALAGEPAAPKSSEPFRPTTAQLTEFYRATSAELRIADKGHHLISTGGLLFLDWDSGIDWQTIFSLPTIDIAAVHVYSSGDQVAMQTVSAWASTHGKPFVVEEFGFPQSLGDQQRAAAFQDLYTRSRAANAASIVFWNLGAEVTSASHDVSPTTPATWAVVQTNAPAPAQQGTGLHGEYFDNKNLTGLILTRTDPTITFNWGTGAPAAGVAPDTFSVRWTGQIQPRYSETYTFSTTSDDGVRLWINDQVLIDNWSDHAVTENRGTITLTAGQRYNIKMEYYDSGWTAVARLEWSSPSQVREHVPQSVLYPQMAVRQNLALNRPATADSVCQSTETVGKAVDGLTSGNSKWCSPGTGSPKRWWWSVDLGIVVPVAQVAIKHAGAGGESTSYNTRDFSIEASPDGKTWTTVAIVSGNTASETRHTFAATSARFVRVLITTPTQTTDRAARLYEVEIYGEQ